MNATRFNLNLAAEAAKAEPHAFQTRGRTVLRTDANEDMTGSRVKHYAPNKHSEEVK